MNKNYQTEEGPRPDDSCAMQVAKVTCIGKAGFTLVELMVALFVMTVLSLGIAGTLTSARQAGMMARERQIALGYARMEIENRIAGGYSNLAIGSEDIVETMYSGRARITTRNTNDSMRMIEVDIFYNVLGRDPQQVSLSAAVSDVLH